MSLTYDYIVVGAGTSGAIIAHDLLNRGSVLVLEEGFNQNSNNEISETQVPTNFEYSHVNIINSDSLTYRGKMWGGTSGCYHLSGINPAMRASSQFHDQMGPLWSFESVTEKYKELETWVGSTDKSLIHGTTGPLTVTMNPVNASPSSLASILVSELANQANISISEDYNLPVNTLAFTTTQEFVKVVDSKQFRSFTGKAFLNSNTVTSNGIGVDNKPIRIISGAFVERILFQDNQAIGVEYTINGKSYQAYANKIIIAAGAINSPLLLMRSGIGPAELLNKYEIPVTQANDKVGSNLQTHIGVSLKIRASSSVQFSSVGALLAINSTQRNILLLTSPGKSNLFQLDIYLLKPTGRGQVKITGADSHSDPEIRMNFYPAEDLKTLRKAIKFVQQVIANIPELTMIPTDLPLNSFIEENLILTLDWSSTCSMNQVVDERLNVIGVKNLAVADLSIYPEIPDAPIMFSSMIIGKMFAGLQPVIPDSPKCLKKLQTSSMETQPPPPKPICLRKLQKCSRESPDEPEQCLRKYQQCLKNRQIEIPLMSSGLDESDQNSYIIARHKNTYVYEPKPIYKKKPNKKKSKKKKDLSDNTYEINMSNSYS